MFRICLAQPNRGDVTVCTFNSDGDYDMVAAYANGGTILACELMIGLGPLKLVNLDNLKTVELPGLCDARDIQEAVAKVQPAPTA